MGFASTSQGDRVAEPVAAFFDRHGGDFGYTFVSWQPRNRNRHNVDSYRHAFDDMFGRVADQPVRALHHTALNLATTADYDRDELIVLTNELIERYDLSWVNEDLGIWSCGGRPLPYPLPPLFTDEGLRACIRNTSDVQGRLAAPLVVEFPGFSYGTSVVAGTWHAYDYFAEVVRQTESPATLDTGHLLSYQILRGAKGEQLYADLDRLPLENCFEIHLSGCAIEGDRFLDYHHGILIDEQLVLLEHLLARCPNVRAVTYEDPRFDRVGRLPEEAVRNYRNLKQIAGAWRQRGRC